MLKKEALEALLVILCPSLWIVLAYIKFDLILLQVVLQISHGVCNDDILPDSLLCIR